MGRSRVRVPALAVLAGALALAGCGHLPPGDSTATAPPPPGASPTVAPSATPASAPATPGTAPPPFFADSVVANGAGGQFEVRDSATGKLLARDTHIHTGLAAIAGTGGRGFVIAVQGSAPLPGNCTVRLYRLHLSSTGVPGRPVPLGPRMHGEVWSLAADAGGGRVAYAISGCSKGNPGYIRVLDIRTGRTRQWGDVRLGGVSPGTVGLNGGLSMSANGRMLAFTGWDVTPDGRSTKQVVRLLPTGASPGTVAARSRTVLTRPLTSSPPSSLLSAVLSPDAASFYLCTVQSGSHQRVTRVAAYSATTGRLRRALATFRAPAGAPLTGCAEALSFSGRFLLVPWSLRGASGTSPLLKMARIDVASGTSATLALKLPAAGGMQPFTGLQATAW